MKRLMINITACLIITTGGLMLTFQPSELFGKSNDQIEETRCGSCSTPDPNKCCRTKIFKRCEIYICN